MEVSVFNIKMTEIKWNLSALCRCCHKDGQFTDLRTLLKDADSNFISLLQDTFNIWMGEPIFEASYAICDTCIAELIRAHSFKVQVVKCEQKFHKYCQIVLATDCNLKEEVESLHGDVSDDNDFEPKQQDDRIEYKYFVDVKPELADHQEAGHENQKVIEIKQENPESALLGFGEGSSEEIEDGSSTYGLHPRLAKKPILKMEVEDNIQKNTSLPEVTASVKSQPTETCINKSKINKEDLSLDVKNKDSPCDSDKTYKQSNNLNAHIKSHTGDKPYKCDICDNKFTQKRSLNDHMRIHTKEKPYKCVICDKTFTQSAHLNCHLRIHTGVTPFKCDICDKKFSLSLSLNRHMRIHTKEKPYKCDICNKKFTVSHQLNNHLRIHTGETPFKCDICDKKFSQKGNLNCHMRIHRKERPFKCDACDKTFTQAAHLHSHLRIHTGEAPFKCDICDKRFTQKSSLKCHMRIHTREKVVQSIINSHLCSK